MTFNSFLWVDKRSYNCLNDINYVGALIKALSRNKIINRPALLVLNLQQAKYMNYWITILAPTS